MDQYKNETSSSATIAQTMRALPLALHHAALRASTDTFINRAHKFLLRTQTRALAAPTFLIQMEIVCRTHIRLFGERWMRLR
jgi:hypothetical protein